LDDKPDSLPDHLTNREAILHSNQMFLLAGWPLVLFLACCPVLSFKCPKLIGMLPIYDFGPVQESHEQPAITQTH
jgi:hypothetical protein